MKLLIRSFVVAVLLVLSTSAFAAEIKVLCTNGVRAVVQELVPQFERNTTSGDKVVLLYEPSTQLRKRIDAGEPFDLVIMTTTLVDEEIKAGKLAADSRTFIARSGLGVSIRSGAKKPNIATVDAFKRALLNADSITFAQQGASAQPFEVLVAKLGITSQLRPKYNLRNTASEVGEAVANGVVELGIAPVSEILPVRGVDLVGPFPKDVQSYVEMTGAVSVNAKQKDEATKLLAFLIAPANLPEFKVKGMER
ncbi:MAG TPA: substrate-binding domain-containing protein [Vicinamibacterales bacterium]|nr:substrate-binding domain-containing protein [Vicinamibacterales bacterium]